MAYLLDNIFPHAILFEKLRRLRQAKGCCGQDFEHAWSLHDINVKMSRESLLSNSQMGDVGRILSMLGHMVRQCEMSRDVMLITYAMHSAKR